MQIRFIKQAALYAALPFGLSLNAFAQAIPHQNTSAEVKEKPMTPEEVENMIRDDNANISNEMYDAIEKKDYPFFQKYLRDPPEAVRERLVLLLQSFNQPFCFKYYLVLLNDPSGSIRNLACQGIGMLGKTVDGDALLPEINRLNSMHAEGREYGVIDLILAIGNTENPKFLDSLLTLYQREKDPDVRLAYQQATAKLGYKKTIREIELELITASGPGKDEALGKDVVLHKVEYIDDSLWIEKVKPLLLDERVGKTFPFGPYRKVSRVCDLAMDVLRKIDPDKRIEAVEPQQIADSREKIIRVQYSEKEILQARRAYGLVK